MNSILKQIFSFILIFTLLSILSGCIDYPENSTLKVSTKKNIEFKNPPYPGDFKTVEKNGVEYLQARGEVGRYGGTYYSTTPGQGPQTFNAWSSKDATSSQMAGLMFDSLITTDPYTGKPVPSLAKSFSISKDNLQYTVTLRKGLVWSDGKPITANDIVFTWNQIIKTGFGNPSSLENLLIDGKLPRIQKINDLTVKFYTSKPYAPFLTQMGGIQIAPEHILKKVVEKGDKEFSAFWGVDADPKSFACSGKFILKRYDTGQRIEFIKNPQYYMVDKAGNKLPYLDKYVVFIVADKNGEIFKFKAKETDIVDVPGSSAAKFKEEEPKSDYKIYNLGPTTTTSFIVFNLNNRINPKTGKYYVDPVKSKWFTDNNFRKAIDWTVDRVNIVNNVIQGVGAPLFTAEGLPSIFLNKKLALGHPQDKKKALEFLKKSEFKLINNVLFDKNENKVEFNLITNASNTEREEIGVMLKEDLKDLGINVNFKTMEFNSLVAKITEARDWDCVILGLTGSPLEPHSGRNVWNSDGTLHLFNLRSTEEKNDKSNRYSFETQIDEIFEQGASTLDFKKRKEIYDKYQQIVYDNNLLIYLYSPLRIIAVRNRLGNIKPTSLGGTDYNLEEIYIKDEK